ncbi:hypothetical protein H3U50_03930 [Lactobacillus sp. M0398]|uniref:hypothetical protein n=1 Tax=unclassified Lactobacillus TaxID=2620435 RepID=UPI0018DEC0EA|nr:MULTISPECIES: hypothetical protein [unclassified Lactobacillus]MBI0120964.1 hypothetical protein [Lactobacillus sp. M0398]MBI0123111.1 hypothetical protein [Lactobacillus sp. W8174]MBI0135279.1 hypothetical protein [Lactobacillus sp. W8173]
MINFVKALNKLFLGNFGKGIIHNISTNMIVYMIGFLIYGFLLMYARIIYLFYVPKEIEKIVLKNRNLPLGQIYELWLKHKKAMGFWLLVPTKNELWVQKLNSSNGSYDVLFYNKNNSYHSEYDLLTTIYQKL